VTALDPAPQLLTSAPVPIASAHMDLTALSETSLIDDIGGPHRLGDLWSDRPTVVVFLRHFG
jgi:hypothetical protein